MNTEREKERERQEKRTRNHRAHIAHYKIAITSIMSIMPCSFHFTQEKKKGGEGREKTCSRRMAVTTAVQFRTTKEKEKKGKKRGGVNGANSRRTSTFSPISVQLPPPPFCFNFPSTEGKEGKKKKREGGGKGGGERKRRRERAEPGWRLVKIYSQFGCDPKEGEGEERGKGEKI